MLFDSLSEYYYSTAEYRQFSTQVESPSANKLGQNFELRVTAAVAVGGASLNGGTGSIGGSVLGVVFLAIVYNAFAMSGLSTYWQDVVSGVMVLAAVLLAQVAARESRARRAAGRGNQPTTEPA